MPDSSELRPDGFSARAVDLEVPGVSTPKAGLVPGFSGEMSMPLDVKGPSVSAEGGRDPLFAGLTGGPLWSQGGASTDRPSSRGRDDPLWLAGGEPSPAGVAEALEARAPEKDRASTIPEKRSEAVDALFSVVGGEAGGDATGATAVHAEGVGQLVSHTAATKGSTPTPEPSEPSVSGTAAAAVAAVAAGAVPGATPESSFAAGKKTPNVEGDKDESTVRVEVEVSCRGNEL